MSCIHHMGGSIRKEFDCNKITHLIANKVGGEKYQYAVTFKIPVMNSSWVHSAWEKRHELGVRAIDSPMVFLLVPVIFFTHYLNPFYIPANKPCVKDFRRHQYLLDRSQWWGSGPNERNFDKQRRFGYQFGRSQLHSCGTLHLHSNKLSVHHLSHSTL